MTKKCTYCSAEVKFFNGDPKVVQLHTVPRGTSGQLHPPCAYIMGDFLRDLQSVTDLSELVE